jgi:putative ABC transport system ATP-binding protein
VDLSQVWRTYPGPPAVDAVRDCTVHVAAGEHVAVVGASGSGKSTLLNLVGLLDRPTRGTYRVDGVDTTDLDDRDRTHLRSTAIGFVFQAFHLLADRSATENVELALACRHAPRRGRRRAAQDALQRVGLAARMESETTRMSGGERQRVAIARALVGEPRLLLCDEPTGNLDSVTTDAVMDLLDTLHGQGVTLVVVTHNLDVAARADRILEMRDGLLVAQPTGERQGLW